MQNFMKTILSAVQTWTKGKIKDSTADWNQNDSSADNYVKNRTHWTEENVLLVDNLTREQYENGNLSPCDFIEGEVYKVVFNGEIYDNLICYGDGEFDIIASSDKGQPFCIDDNGGNSLYIEADGDWTISIYGNIVHKLDSKYLDFPTNLATTDDVQEAIDDVQEAIVTIQDDVQEAINAANTVQSTVNNKMDSKNPVGTGSFRMNSNASIGTCSYTLGNNNKSLGNYSGAFGYNTTADFSYMFVSGKYNKITYTVSKNRENTLRNSCKVYIFDDYVYNESLNAFELIGLSSDMVRIDSLRKGQKYFIGSYKTTSEGIPYIDNFSEIISITYSSSDMSKIIENKYVTSSASSSYTGPYAHIVGNGTSDTKRSNAHTIDWNGVGWFQGGLQVGGNAQDDGAKNVLLEGDVLPADWNQNDETKPDYVKNRTHYAELTMTNFLPQQDVVVTKHPTKNCYWYSNILKDFDFIENSVYTITFNNVEYQCLSYVKDGFKYIGNVSLWDGSTDTGNNEPFVLRIVGSSMSFIVAQEGTYNLMISGFAKIYHKIDGNYTGIYNLDNGAIALTQNTLSGGGNKSFSIHGSAVGEHSFAHGPSSMAVGKNSFAISASTAYSENQFTIGKNNVVDLENTYIHIAGNGNASSRSNAHTLDWDGNAWYAGDIYVGSTSGTDKDDGSKKLATEEYVNNSMSVMISVPAYTIEDEGAVLRIVNGVPTWVKLINGEDGEY